jgi:S1-C subfamily serine protease
VPRIKEIARSVDGVHAVHFLHPDLRAPRGPAYFGADAVNDPSVFGAKINEVVPGSPADKAGIKVGDVIREFNNQTIPNARALDKQVAACPAGARVEVRVYRGGGNAILGARLLDSTVLAGS